MNVMEERNNRTTLWITIVVALPVLYVLSTGPVIWVLQTQLHISEEPVWFKFYIYPLMWLVEHWPAFEYVLMAYFDLWDIK